MMGNSPGCNICNKTLQLLHVHCFCLWSHFVFDLIEIGDVIGCVQDSHALVQFVFRIPPLFLHLHLNRS
ncbi:hypothetical protein FKM82_017052 [Ascaphus truei]